ncbi:unnamed protein product, partial [Polarella glacialis]
VERLQAALAEAEARAEAAQARLSAAPCGEAAEVGLEALSGRMREAQQAIAELRRLCQRTSGSLSAHEESGSTAQSQATSPDSSCEETMEAELASCREAALSAHVAAERVMADRRQLLAKLQQLEESERRREKPPTTSSAPGAEIAPNAPTEEQRHWLHRRKEQEASSRNTAQALKEIRLHAEQQLAWVLQRMSQADLPGRQAAPVCSVSVGSMSAS